MLPLPITAILMPASNQWGHRSIPRPRRVPAPGDAEVLLHDAGGRAPPGPRLPFDGKHADGPCSSPSAYSARQLPPRAARRMPWQQTMGPAGGDDSDAGGDAGEAAPPGRRRHHGVAGETDA